MTVRINWVLKMKKKVMKLKELSVLGRKRYVVIVVYVSDGVFEE